MTSTRVFLLRHAESADPTVFHGAESDVELGAVGHRQAARVAEVLAARKPDLLVSSGMRRALQTAAPIALACGLTVIVEPQLHERRVGALGGKTFAENGLWPETVKRWSSGETSFATAGAESFDEIQARVLPVWERLAEEHRGKNIVVVAHGIVCKVILLSILPDYSVKDWERLGPIPNAAIHELVHEDGTWKAVALNQKL